MKWTRIATMVVCAALLSGCSVVRTTAQPKAIKPADVPFGLLDPTIPFTNQLTVTFAERTIYFVNEQGLLAPQQRLLPTPHTLAQSLNVMTAGPTSAEAADGVVTYVPTVVHINQATLHSGVGYVDLSGVFLSLSLVGRQRAAAQIVMTALAAGATNGVRFTVAQQPYRATLPDGRDVSVLTPSDVNYLVQH